MTVTILRGDCREVFRELPADSVHCIVTSPPYWGLRDYGMDGQIGLEGAYPDYVDKMAEVFADVRRILRKDGTVWLNLGDSYHSGDRGGYRNDAHRWENSELQRGNRGNAETIRPNRLPQLGLKDKDLVGIPWRVAFALQADGWYLRQDIIWSKPNPMPESVRDRCTKAHEYLFLLSKSERYYYDAEAIREEHADSNESRLAALHKHGDGATGEVVAGAVHKNSPYYHQQGQRGLSGVGTTVGKFNSDGRNKRSVWEIATQPFPEAHFATFPPALIEPCIKAGCPEKCCAKCGAPWVRKTDGASYYQGDDGSRDRKTNMVGNGHGGAGRGPKNDLGSSIAKTIGWSPSCSCNAGTIPGTVLDCFGGAGTTGLVADRLGRNAILIELNPDYAAMAERRIKDDAGMFADVS